MLRPEIDNPPTERRQPRMRKTPSSRLKTGRRVAALVIAIVLSACGRDPTPERAGYYPIFSPNGEPLSGGPLGRLDCATALTSWFDHLAKGNRLDHDTFMADARRQFAAMDLGHDGVITPAELAAYRGPYISERDRDTEGAAQSDGTPARAARPGTGRPAGGSSASDRAKGSDADGRRDPAADRPDPVMAADTRLRNEVVLDDFLAHAERSFAALDTGHAGALTRSNVLAQCRK